MQVPGMDGAGQSWKCVCWLEAADLYSMAAGDWRGQTLD